jgi:hypothetical protein
MFGTKAKPGQPIDWIIVKVSVACPRQEKYLSHTSQNFGYEGHPQQPDTVPVSVASYGTEKKAFCDRYRLRKRVTVQFMFVLENTN